jgi:hypothetical protein
MIFTGLVASHHGAGLVEGAASGAFGLVDAGDLARPLSRAPLPRRTRRPRPAGSINTKLMCGIELGCAAVNVRFGLKRTLTNDGDRP